MASVMRCVAQGSWSRLRENNNNNHSSRKNVNREFKVSCAYSSSVSDPYKTLKIEPGSSESDVKKAFRKLALQYHPDVCKGSNSGIQFNQIYEAYEIVMSRFRGEANSAEQMEIYEDYDDTDDSMRGMNDEDWDMWEEWMGWEGAGIRDYSSHINPYI